MATRFERGHWVVDYYPHGRKGKRRRFSLPEGTTEETAKLIEQQLKKEKSPLASSRDPIRTLVPAYLEYVRLHQAERTYHDKKNCFHNCIIPFFGNMKIQDLTNATLQLYQKKRKHEIEQKLTGTDGGKSPTTAGRGNRTINKELDYFFAFLKWAKKTIGITPPKKLERDRLPYKRPIPNVLTFDEAVRLMAAADSQMYRVLFLMLFNLGLRFNEARHLKWSDLDMEARTVKIYRKGGKTDILPMSEWLYHELAVLARSNGSEWLFPSPMDRRKPVTDIRKALRRAKERAGITKKINPHLLRHSLATHLLGKGINLRTIQEILGHEQISTTEFYTKVLLQHKRDAFAQAGLDMAPNDAVFCDSKNNGETN